MISTRSTAQGNAQRSEDAIKFAQVFFQKQDREKTTLFEMYHDQATLVWNGQMHKSKTAIQKFYQSQQTIETTLEALDAQIMPQMGDIIDMITIIAGGKLKQHNDENLVNFSRTFLLGPDSPSSTEYKIISDTLRTQT